MKVLARQTFPRVGIRRRKWAVFSRSNLFALSWAKADTVGIISCSQDPWKHEHIFRKKPFYHSLMTERGSVVCLSFGCKILIIPENKTKQKTLENWSVQSSENCLVPEVQLHAFCGFFFEYLGWPSVRAYSQTLTGCGQNFCNLWRGFSSGMSPGCCGCQAMFGCLF